MHILVGDKKSVEFDLINTTNKSSYCVMIYCYINQTKILYDFISYYIYSWESKFRVKDVLKISYLIGKNYRLILSICTKISNKSTLIFYNVCYLESK